MRHVVGRARTRAASSDAPTPGPRRGTPSHPRRVAGHAGRAAPRAGERPYAGSAGWGAIGSSDESRSSHSSTSRSYAGLPIISVSSGR